MGHAPRSSAPQRTGPDGTPAAATPGCQRRPERRRPPQRSRLRRRRAVLTPDDCSRTNHDDQQEEPGASAQRDQPKKFKKKTSVLVTEKVEYVDYKDVNLLHRFVSDRSKIRNRRVTGNTVQQQRDIANAVKNAREMALLPYTKRVSPARAPVGRRATVTRMAAVVVGVATARVVVTRSRPTPSCRALATQVDDDAVVETDDETVEA